jgi:F0F1-type ATP synthase membrane subunit b/b'
MRDTMSSRHIRKSAPLLAALLTAASLASCSPEKPGPFEKAGQKADKAVDDAQAEIEKAAEQTRRNLEEAKKKAIETGEAVSEKAKQAGEDASREAKKAGDAASKFADGLRREIAKPDQKPTPKR